MAVSREELDKEGITKFTITNKAGTKLSIINLGATITELVLPSGVDIVLGYQDLNDYKQNPFYLGTSVGRVANRMRDAKFTLDGKTYQLSANIPPHILHGGKVGFNKAIWAVGTVGANCVSMSLDSPDGDQGFPGALRTTVTYTLTESSDVVIEYWAELLSGEAQSTIVNMTNHTYFNLDAKDTILNHKLTINSDSYNPLDDELIATGAVAPVKDTPLDFTSPHLVGERIIASGGYDINYNMLENKTTHSEDPSLKHFATLASSRSNVTMKVFSNQAGVQLYTGNFLDGSSSGPGKDGCPFIRHSGLCLETQAWPNAINIPGAEDQVILRPGKKYCSKTIWSFS